MSVDISKCEVCHEDCPQAQGKHEAALGRMYAMHEFVKCAPYWDALFDENELPKITPDRLRELVEADRDGRCVVLPVKPGGMVRFAANPRAKHEKVDCINIYADGRIMYGFHETGMKTRWVDEWSEDESEKYVAVDATLEGEKDGKETE